MREKVILMCKILMVLLSPIIGFYVIAPASVKAQIDQYSTWPCIIVGVVVVIFAVVAVRKEKRA